MLLYHGVSFFLARSKANKTPVPAFKIQQKGKKISRKVTKVLLLLPQNCFNFYHMTQKKTTAHSGSKILETFFKAILGTDLGQVCKFWGVNLAPEPLKLTSFHGQIDQ